MGIWAVVLVAAIGCSVTIFAAARLWRAQRSGAPRELVLGYLALMLGASVVSLLVLRAL